MGDLNYISADLSIKSVDQMQRVISGFAAYHSNRDRGQDIIDPTASVKAVTRLGGNVKQVGVFVGHQTSSLPMGVPLVIEARPEGLYTETLIKPGPGGDDLLATAAFLQQHNSALGMSIGYRTHDSKMERGSQGFSRRILDYGLAEYSYAANQAIMNESALVVGVKSRDKAMTEGDDSRGGVTVDKAATEYRIEQRPDGWHVLDDDDGDDLGTFDSREEAQTAIDALNNEENEAEDDADKPARKKPMKGGKTAEAVKAVWSTAQVNDLPDSSFLFIESGGVKDDEGKTTPRTLRHFPYKDAEGKIDLPHLRNAIARIPQSTADGLNKNALQARAQRMLAAADGGGDAGKTIDEAPEWQGGAPLTIWHVGYQLQALAEQVAESHKAMTFLGEDTKAGARMQSAMRQKLREAITTLTDLANWAETVDAEKDAAAKVAHYQRSLELLALDLAS